MKNLSKLILAVLAASTVLALVGCDDETHPDPRLQQSANAQRQAQRPGQAQQPPTGNQGQ